VGKWRKETLTEKIITACINVHKDLGPGFLESKYQTGRIRKKKGKIGKYPECIFFCSPIPPYVFYMIVIYRRREGEAGKIHV